MFQIEAEVRDCIKDKYKTLHIWITFNCDWCKATLADFNNENMELEKRTIGQTADGISVREVASLDTGQAVVSASLEIKGSEVQRHPTLCLKESLCQLLHHHLTGSLQLGWRQQEATQHWVYTT